MNFYSAKILAQRTLADQCNARIAAMQAANRERRLPGGELEPQVYDEKAFMAEADELGRIYIAIENLAENAQ